MTTNRYKHLRFWVLSEGEDFFSGRLRYTKTGWSEGRAVLDGQIIFVLPWRKVRSARPYGPPQTVEGGDRGKKIV